MTAAFRIAERLSQDDIISRSLNESLARIVRNIQELNFEAGDEIYAKDEEAEYLYLIVSGTVRHQIGPQNSVTSSDRFGEEAATDLPRYVSDAVAETNLVVHARLSILSIVGNGVRSSF